MSNPAVRAALALPARHNRKRRTAELAEEHGDPRLGVARNAAESAVRSTAWRCAQVDPDRRRPGTKIIEEIDHGTRTVNGVEAQVIELVWNGTTGRSFDVIRTADDANLTEHESFDTLPTDEQIAGLLDQPRTPPDTNSEAE